MEDAIQKLVGEMDFVSRRQEERQWSKQKRQVSPLRIFMYQPAWARHALEDTLAAKALCA